jgi:dipeptidyl aminopeptidase/acylaminoacyl peptidase
LNSYELQRLRSTNELANGTTVNTLPFPRTARRNGPETSIVFVNRTPDKVKLLWVNRVDDPRLYEQIEPGQEHSQHTYSGHVWLVTDQRDKPIGVYEAIDSDGIAVIDGSWRQGQRRSGASSQEGRGRRRAADQRTTSPDGRWSARIEDHNVVLKNTADGDETRLTSNGTESDPYLSRFYWSPNSEKLVVIQRREGENRTVHVIESSPSDQVQPKLISFKYEKPGDQIAHPRPRLFDVETKTSIEISDDLFANPWSITQIRWAPDSSRFTFLYNQRGHQVLRVVGVDADTGETTSIIDEKSETFICYSSKTYFRQIDATEEIIWMSERDGWNHLYLVDARTGEVKNQITKDAWVVRNVERVDEEKRQIWFTAGGIHSGQDPYHLHYCRVNFDGSELVPLTAGNGTHSVEYSPDRQFLIDTYSRVDLPPVVELRRVHDGSLICGLEQADWSKLLEIGWRTPERFVAKGRDGTTDIYGVIFRPTTFDPEQRYPVIEKIYAGPHSAHVPKRFSAYHGAQAMAEIGFVVVQIDGMGTSHRSKAFHDVCWQNLADAGFPDRVAWIKAAAATRPWMDISRVGIYGGSAGGQNAMRALIDHGDFYQAAAADCGCHDNRMDKIWWNEQWMGWPVGPHYAQSSNVEHAERVQGHLMLLVGELDRNVDPASTMQVVNALVKADKDFELVVLPGRGHGAGGSRYGTRRQRDFFVRHLLGSRAADLDASTPSTQ